MLMGAQGKANAESWTAADRLAALRLCPLFAGWPEARLAEVAAIARAGYYPRGAEIFARDPERREAFVIVSGEVEVSRGSAAGKKFVLSVQGAFEILAIVRLLAEPPIHYVYTAYEDSVLLHLPCDGLAAILDADPILWRDIALLMCVRHGDSLRQLNNQKLGTLDQRMAATLADLSRIHGVAGDKGVELALRLPQEQLGAMLGVTRQSINKLLRGFEDRGVIAVDYNRITICDPAALDAIVTADD